eukprot:4870602-Karenia_brevis.AAC.1
MIVLRLKPGHTCYEISDSNSLSMPIWLSSSFHAEIEENFVTTYDRKSRTLAEIFRDGAIRVDF